MVAQMEGTYAIQDVQAMRVNGLLPGDRSQEGPSGDGGTPVDGKSEMAGGVGSDVVDEREQLGPGSVRFEVAGRLGFAEDGSSSVECIDIRPVTVDDERSNPSAVVAVDSHNWSTTVENSCYFPDEPGNEVLVGPAL